MRFEPWRHNRSTQRWVAACSAVVALEHGNPLPRRSAPSLVGWTECNEFLYLAVLGFAPLNPAYFTNSIRRFGRAFVTTHP